MDARTSLISVAIVTVWKSIGYYSLIIMKKQRFIFAGYGLTALLALFLSEPFVRAMGIFGGAAAYVVLMAVLAALFGILAMYFIHRKGRDGQ